MSYPRYYMKRFLAVSDVTKKVDKFYKDHHEDVGDSNFARYIFAVCTSWYLKTNTTNDKMGELLLMATSSFRTILYYDDAKERDTQKLRTPLTS